MSLPVITLTNANTVGQLIFNVNRIKTLSANGSHTVSNTQFQSALANTNAYIGTKSDTATLTASYVANAAFQSALANTNSYINTVATSGVSNGYLTSTYTSNTTFQSALANTNAYIAATAASGLTTGKAIAMSIVFG